MEGNGKTYASGAARLAVLALYGWIAIEFLEIVTCLDYVAGDGYDTWFATVPILRATILASLVGELAVGIVVLVWFYRAMAAAHRLTPGLTISPSWAVGWFFVPVASLWKPYEAMVEIVEGSGATDGRGRPVRDLIAWWWGAWVGRNIISVFLQFGQSSGLTRGIVILEMVVAAMGVAAAIVLQMIIQGVGRLQRTSVDASIFD